MSGRPYPFHAYKPPHYPLIRCSTPRHRRPLGRRALLVVSSRYECISQPLYDIVFSFAYVFLRSIKRFNITRLWLTKVPRYLLVCLWGRKS